MTSATIALQYRKILDKWAEKTCDNNEHVDFQGHDFSLRGMASLDAGLISGAGHLTSFKGTDTIPAICYLEQYYNADVEPLEFVKEIKNDFFEINYYLLLKIRILNALNNEH